MAADVEPKKQNPYPDWRSGVTFVLWGLLAFGAPSILSLSGATTDACTWVAVAFLLLGLGMSLTEAAKYARVPALDHLGGLLFFAVPAAWLLWRVRHHSFSAGGTTAARTATLVLFAFAAIFAGNLLSELPAAVARPGVGPVAEKLTDEQRSALTESRVRLGVASLGVLAAVLGVVEALLRLGH